MLRFFARPARLLRSITRTLFGTMNWEPPPWGPHAVTAIRWPFRPKKLNRAVLALLVLLSAGGWWWWHLPEPHKVTFEVLRPHPTKLEKDALPEPLIVRFSGSAASLEKIGKDVSKALTVTPPLAGIWTWASGSELTFKPSSDWEVGKTYSVKFDKALFAPRILLKDKKFSFDSPYFTPVMKGGEFYEDPTDPKNKQAVVTVLLTHPVDKSSFERHVSLKMIFDPVKNFDARDAKPLGFTVVYKDDGSEAYIRSERIQIPERDGEIMVALDKGVSAQKGGLPSADKISRTVHVPGVENYFKITAVKAGTVTNPDTYVAERTLSFESTAAVSQKELIANTEAFLLSDDPGIYTELPKADLDSDEDEGAYDEDEGSEGEDGEEEVAPPEPLHCPLQSAGQVTSRILEKAEKLRLDWVEPEQEFSQIQSAKFKAGVGRCIYVRIKKGTKSFGDYPLTDDRGFLEQARPFTPDVRIVGDGSILSATGEKKLSIMTRNLDSVRFKLFRILPGALHHLTTQTESYSKFSDPQFNYNFGPQQISEVFTTTAAVPPGEPGTPRYTAFDFGSYLASVPAAPRGLFILEASGWDESRKIVVWPSTKRLVLLTDLGFLVKESQFGTRDVFVTSLTKGGGVMNADIQLLGKNGLPIYAGKTDEKGHALLPSFRSFTFEKEPTVFVVMKDGDLSFMPFEKRDREINFSRFDIGGLYTQKEQEALQAYLFSDRGIYRPGETAHIGVIVKNTEWRTLPQSLPLEISVTEPRGIEIKRAPVRVGADGFIEFTFPVSESALTGSYQVALSLVRPKKGAALLGTTSVRVDEFLPDRLKIDAGFSGNAEQAWRSPDDLNVHVNLKNLFGTAAAGNRIRGSFRLTPLLPFFQQYRDYTFFDPFRAKSGFSEQAGDISTDENGDASFELGLGRFDRSIYQLSFVAEGFEKEGGRSVIANLSTIVNPLPFMIGFKANGDRTFIKRDTKVGVELIAVDPSLKRTSASGLSLELIEKRYVSILTKLPSGSLSYQSVEKKAVLSTVPLTVPEGGANLSFPSADPGTFVYVIKDGSGLVLSEIGFSVVGDANSSRSLERNAELKLKLDKTSYAPGETIHMDVQAPYTGTGLITIERNKVFTWKWFTTDTTSSVQTITVPEGIEGNGYVSVSFVRSLSSPDVYMSPLSYGVEPFSIGRERRTEAVTLKAPALVVPGTPIRITVSTKERARTAVFGVDEGILQVARYRTPDPLSHFYRKRALEVSTAQILDLLLPEFGLVRNTAAAGGDDDALLARHRNPFKRKGQKPVVFWSGIVETGPEGTSFEMPTPDYFNGSVKLFAVSVTASAVGVSESQVTVQGDVILTPNVPLAAAPGDEFEVSTVVSNVRGGENETDVSIETGTSLSIIGENRKRTAISRGKDDVVTFRLKALDSLGPTDVKFAAQNGSARSTYTVDLSIRPQSAYLAAAQYGHIGGAESSADVSLERVLYPQLADRSLTASALPLGLSGGLRSFLEKYPHGCSEQLASQAYPALVYIDRPELGVPEWDARSSIEKALGILSSRQNEDGSFKLWPGFDAEPLLSVHIIRLLLEARDRGISIPYALYTNSVSYLRGLAARPISNIKEARTQSYAIYLLTRDGQVTTPYLTALHGALKQMGREWREDITALYLASAYAMLKLDREAVELASAVPVFTSPKEASYFEDNLSHTAQVLYLLARHFPGMLSRVGPAALEKCADELSLNRYNTLSAALLMLGLSEYQKALPPTASGISVQTTPDGKTFSPLALSNEVMSRAAVPDGTKSLRITGTGNTPVFYALSESGFDRGGPAKTQSGVEIFREYRNMKGEVISEAALGDDIDVRIVVRAIDPPALVGEVAVTDLFPAGFELQGGSLALGSGSSRYGSMNWYLHYTDAREDRALLYGSLDSAAREYVYKVKAVSRGVFAVPPVQIESMYNQRFVARGDASQFTIH